MGSLRRGRIGVALAVLACAAIAGLGPAAAQRKEPPPSRAAAQYSFAPIVKKAAPAVVNVYVQRARADVRLAVRRRSPVPPLLRRAASAARRAHAELAGLGRDRAPPTASSSPTRTWSRSAAPPRSASRSPTGASSMPRSSCRTRSPTSPCSGSRAATGAFPTSSSRTPTRSRSATWCWRSATRSASARPSPAASSRRSPAPRSAATRPRCSSRPMPPSTPATPAARWWTWRARWSASTRRSSPAPAARTAWALPYPPTWSS